MFLEMLNFFRKSPPRGFFVQFENFAFLLCINFWNYFFWSIIIIILVIFKFCLIIFFKYLIVHRLKNCLLCYLLCFLILLILSYFFYYSYSEIIFYSKIFNKIIFVLFIYSNKIYNFNFMKIILFLLNNFNFIK